MLSATFFKVSAWTADRLAQHSAIALRRDKADMGFLGKRMGFAV
ncbi:hypothetical protein GCM10007320_13430 [Pseudorhodoferax aquiterrae]|uniref:Uncharacterized protein n=1 Tax=Pseudorhodoferax aquiterrae TaxID=747304 RepID=A0ABQ3FYP0_9BURK|nr:hypothetical protein GCM10007320_13430 [Pseudorhodoferax aquiterrae]